MINFVIKEDKSGQIIDQVKRVVTVITSVVLIVYIVVAAGVIGWMVWENSRAKKTTVDTSDVIKQIQDLSAKEIVIRNLADRANLVESFLGERGDSSQSAYLLGSPGNKIVSWNYVLGGAEVVSVAASQPAELKVYMDYLGEKYVQVRTEKVEWTPENGWKGIFDVTRKKGAT